MPEFTSEEPAEKIEDATQPAAKGEISSPHKRKYRILLFQIVLFLAIGAFAMLTVMVKTTPSFPIDLHITRAIQSADSPFLSAIMNLISWPGFSPQSFIIPVLVVLLVYSFGFHWEAVVASIAALFPSVFNVFVKDLIQRPRPSVNLVHVFRILDSYSFPSGHVMFYVGFFGFLWFLSFTLLKHSLMRTLLLVFLGSLIALIGISRIYLGQHWASDVLGAYLLGGLTLAIIFQFYRWGKKRFFTQQPVAPHVPNKYEE
ncbi:MAG: phosphatase PAP2 family protein [Anaerolineales bacterium]